MPSSRTIGCRPALSRPCNKSSDEENLMCFQQVQLVASQPIVQASLVIDKDMKFKIYKMGVVVNENIFKGLVVKLRKDKTASHHG